MPYTCLQCGKRSSNGQSSNAGHSLGDPQAAEKKEESVRIPLLDLSRELQSIGAAIQEQWRQLLERPQFLNGEQVGLFEQEMAAFLGISHVVGTASGTEALILGLAACGISEGDEVILPANAFVAALEAVWWLKARPVLVDIQPWDLGPDPEIGRAHV